MTLSEHWYATFSSQAWGLAGDNCDVHLHHLVFFPRSWGLAELFGEGRIESPPFSPQTWGLTAPKMEGKSIWNSSPHKRGGWPTLLYLALLPFEFSPHPWGLAEHLRGIGLVPLVFPTIVRAQSNRQELAYEH